MQKILEDQRIFLNASNRLVQQVFQRQALLVGGVQNNVWNDLLKLWIIGAALLDRIDCPTVIVQESAVELDVIGETLKKIADLNVAVGMVSLLLLKANQELAMHAV